MRALQELENRDFDLVISGSICFTV
jgi:hypothetical protein